MTRRLIWWLVGLAVALFMMDSIVMPLFVRRGHEFVLPDLSGMRVEPATEMLRELHLDLEIAGEEHSPARLAGTILSQEPTAGTLVKAGRPIRVIVSKGGQHVRLPYLVGVTVRQATLTLTDAGLVTGDVDWAYTDSLPADVVIATAPEAGALVPKGSRIRLLVNQGGNQETVVMPNLVGTRLSDVPAILERLGLELGVVIRQEARDLLPGTVLEQSEPAGAPVSRGDVIDLVIAADEGEA